MDTDIHVMMMVRNERGRHLQRSLESALSIAYNGGGKLLITDDASDDGTYEYLEAFRLNRNKELDREVVRIRQNERPEFMRHEGRARQDHYEWVEEYVRPGDWILSLDADETINSKDHLIEAVVEAEIHHKKAVLIPLYEFWSETEYRTDGYWFGTKSSRLFRYELDGGIRQREFGCGSEPTYVTDHVRRGQAHHQDKVHLLHWGYVREEDRVRKHDIYSNRVGGHGHNNKHIASIVQTPTLKEYEGDMD